jgi:hypothetical protein
MARGTQFILTILLLSLCIISHLRALVLIIRPQRFSSVTLTATMTTVPQPPLHPAPVLERDIDAVNGKRACNSYQTSISR